MFKACNRFNNAGKVNFVDLELAPDSDRHRHAKLAAQMFLKILQALAQQIKPPLIGPACPAARQKYRQDERGQNKDADRQGASP